MCRSCGTAVPSTVHGAMPQDSGATWVTGGPIGSPVTAPAPRSGAALAKAPAAPPTDACPYGPPVGAPGQPHPAPHPEHGYPASAYPGTPQTAGAPPRGLRGIASAVVVLLLVEVGALGAHVYARIQEAALVRDFQDGTVTIPLSRIQANDDLVHSTGLASVGLYVVTLVALMVFSYLATVNVRRWDPSAKHKPGFAAASWIVPFANLVVPWMVLRQAIPLMLVTSASRSGACSRRGRSGGATRRDPAGRAARARPPPSRSPGVRRPGSRRRVAAELAAAAAAGAPDGVIAR